MTLRIFKFWKWWDRVSMTISFGLMLKASRFSDLEIFPYHSLRPLDDNMSATSLRKAKQSPSAFNKRKRDI